MMDSTSYQPCDCALLHTTTWQKSSRKEIETRLSVKAITDKNNAPKHFIEADVVVIYAKGDEVRRCLTCKEAFDEKFHIPSIWWTTLSRRSNGYFGYENVLDESGTIRTGTISWLRFLMKRVIGTDSAHHNKDNIKYEWVKINAFVRWYAVERRTEIVLFDHPQFAQQVGDSLISQVKSCELGDPFWVYPIMTEEVAALQDVCVWESRTLIRNYEKEKERSHYSDPYDYLHEASRHTLHIKETLHVAESVLDSMQKYHDHFISTESSRNEKDYSRPFSQNIQNRLGHLQTTFTHLRHRAESNHERVKAEISLSFNKSARTESAATRTISLVGLLFLPAAYITALFSTSFFNFDAPSGIWGFSDKFWIYWAVTIPVTALTIFSWFFGSTIWGIVSNCGKEIRALLQSLFIRGVRETINARQSEREEKRWEARIRKERERRKEDERKAKKREEEEEKKEEEKRGEEEMEGRRKIRMEALKKMTEEEEMMKAEEEAKERKEPRMEGLKKMKEREMEEKERERRIMNMV